MGLHHLLTTLSDVGVFINMQEYHHSFRDESALLKAENQSSEMSENMPAGLNFILTRKKPSLIIHE